MRSAFREQSKNRAVPSNNRYQSKLSNPGPGHLDIAASKALVPRALRIMQALLAAFDKRGYRVSVTPEHATIVRVLGEPIQIALTEPFKQVVVKHSYGQGIDLEPSGRLLWRIGSTYSLNRLNVATSRARCAAFIVASPALLEPQCRTPRRHLEDP